MRDRDDWHLTSDIEHELGSGDPFAAAVRATRMPMVITNPAVDDNPIVFCNEAFQKLTGYSREEIVGRNCRFLQGPDTDPGSVMSIRSAIDSGRDISIDILNYRKDGSTFWNALYLSPVRNAAGNIQFFFASQLDVTARVEAQALIEQQKAEIEHQVQLRTAALRTALDAKTLLLHEVDHRVKNNLTLIGSLLRLQAKHIGDEAIAAKLDAMLERVDALAAVHRRLYQSDDITMFDVGGLAENLVTDIVGASGRTNVRVICDIQRIDVSSAMATALGLILNEVLINAMKHGFAEGRAGTLQISAKRNDQTALITVLDDGPGVKGTGAPSGGLGSVLIERLARQLGAEVLWAKASPGTKVTISFPLGEQ